MEVLEIRLLKLWVNKLKQHKVKNIPTRNVFLFYTYYEVHIVYVTDYHSIVSGYIIHFLPNTFKKLSLQKFWFPVYWNEKGIG